MEHTLPDLPYEKNALEPVISARTLDFHHGKHHAAYVANLNKLIAGTEFADMSLEDIIRKSSGGVFNNAAQHFNHSFYWNCLAPAGNGGGGEPEGALAEALNAAFGSVEDFREQFSSKAATLFGSGWAWLVRRPDGMLVIEQHPNAGCPLTEGHTPLLTCDVWEHAYYLDYQNARPKYVQEFWKLVNWSFVAGQLEAATVGA